MQTGNLEIKHQETHRKITHLQSQTCLQHYKIAIKHLNYLIKKDIKSRSQQYISFEIVSFLSSFKYSFFQSHTPIFRKARFIHLRSFVSFSTQKTMQVWVFVVFEGRQVSNIETH